MLNIILILLKIFFYILTLVDEYAMFELFQIYMLTHFETLDCTLFPWNFIDPLLTLSFLKKKLS